MVKSPIFYMGNKERMIQKGMLDIFPNNINTLYDLFGGSGVVSLNADAKKYILNDIDTNVYGLYNMFLHNKGEDLIEYIEDIIEEFDIKAGIHKQGFMKKYPTREYPKQEQEIRIQNYNRLREYYNENKNIKLLYILSIFCNSHNIRFNKLGKFNMSIGNSGFIDRHKLEIKDACILLKNMNIEIFNQSFLDFNIDSIKLEDFVYLDPPYMNTLAIYNEQQKWSIDKQNELLDFCDRLNAKNIRFAMSNVFSNKNMTNTNLIDWVHKNNLNVYEFKNMKYTSCGKGNSNAKEVLITNY